MKIMIIGKEHREGTSKKNGKEYNANIVHYLTRARGLEGQRGAEAWLDPAYFPLTDIIVGQEYIIDFDNRGYVQDFYPVEG